MNANYTSNVISSQSEPVNTYTVRILRTEVSENLSKYCHTITKVTSRRVGLNTICDYIVKKFSHCLERQFAAKNVRGFVLRANLEWIISVIETEFDYHVGKRLCAKKRNVKYMEEYKSTQLSGFGEKFYHPTDKISNSMVAKLYPMGD